MSQLKKLSVQIRNIANSLPEQFDVAQQLCLLTGRDIHLSGLDPTGYPMDETEYTINIPVYLRVNHKRALQKAYKKRGIAGIIDYTDSCVKLD